MNSYPLNIAQRFASVVAEVRAALESKREEAERALVDRGKARRPYQPP